MERLNSKDLSNNSLLSPKRNFKTFFLLNIFSEKLMSLKELVGELGIL
jgi:hypothetical protein